MAVRNWLNVWHCSFCDTARDTTRPSSDHVQAHCGAHPRVWSQRQATAQSWPSQVCVLLETRVIQTRWFPRWLFAEQDRSKCAIETTLFPIPFFLLCLLLLTFFILLLILLFSPSSYTFFTSPNFCLILLLLFSLSVPIKSPCSFILLCICPSVLLSW
jgi:hypothetical protein